MKNKSSNKLFSLIRDFIFTHLPVHRMASPHTIRAYQKSLSLFVDFLKNKYHIGLMNVSIAMWTRENIGEFLDYLEGTLGCKTTTRNHRLHCLRAFMRYAADCDASMTSYRIETLKIPDKKNVETKLLDQLSREHMKRLLETPDSNTRKGLRDKTAFVVLYDSAARVQELLNLKVCDLDLGKHPSATLRGKGGTVRKVPLSENTRRLVLKYLSVYHPGESFSSTVPLFYTRRNGVMGMMTTDNVRRLLRHYGTTICKRDKSFPSRVHPHLFRHSRAMHLYEGGLPMPLLSELLGHANMETTLIYAHADAEMKRKAIVKADQGYASQIKGAVFKESDEECLKRLYGLK